MEFEDAPMFHEKRFEVIGGCADQGTEKGMGDDSIRCLEQFSTYEPENRDDLFMYPFLLMLLGMLHVLYNALQEGVTGTLGNQESLASLRAMEAFFRRSARLLLRRVV